MPKKDEYTTWQRRVERRKQREKIDYWREPSLETYEAIGPDGQWTTYVREVKQKPVTNGFRQPRNRSVKSQRRELIKKRKEMKNILAAVTAPDAWI